MDEAEAPDPEAVPEPAAAEEEDTWEGYNEPRGLISNGSDVA